MHVLPLPLRAVGAAAVLAAGASAQIGFQPGQSLPVGLQPDGVAIADFDGDGDRDLAATADQPDRVVVLAQQGGAFAQLSSVQTGGGTSPHRLAAADLDGDGDVDLAVTLQNANQVRILLNNGAGGFTSGQGIGTGAEPRDVVAGDFEGDGDVDLAVANREGGSATILRNDGAASFTAQTVGTGEEPREIAIGDFDGDSDLDVAVSAHDDRRVDVLRNQGASFALAQSIQFFSPHRPEGLTAADLDGDGDVDLAATSGDDAVLAQNVAAVMRNQGGTFSGPTFYPTGGFDSSSIEAADLDQDGDVDLVVANESSSTVTALANSGTATFGAAQTFAVGSEPTDVELGDVDGNGSADVVTANEGSSSLSLLLNQAAGASIQLLAPAAIGTRTAVRLSSPADAGEAYFCGFSGGSTPGITLGDGRVVPLNNDGILKLSLDPANPVFTPTFGALDGAGLATVQVLVPDLPEIVGLTIVSAFVTLEPASPSGIGTISPALAITAVQ